MSRFRAASAAFAALAMILLGGGVIRRPGPPTLNPTT